MMKKLLFTLCTLFYRIFSDLKIEDGLCCFSLCKMLGVSNLGQIRMGGMLNKSRVRMIGNNNKFICEANMHKCEILIEGDNNTVELGRNTFVHAFNILIKGSGCYVRVGENNTSNGTNLRCMGVNNSITIGNDCMFSGQIEIWNTDSHFILDSKSNKPINHSAPIFIGDHVWVGQHATILKGTAIGNNSIIGMNAVVTKDVPPYSVSVGNPAKVVKSGINWDRKQTIDF